MTEKKKEKEKKSSVNKDRSCLCGSVLSLAPSKGSERSRPSVNAGSANEGVSGFVKSSDTENGLGSFLRKLVPKNDGRALQW